MRTNRLEAFSDGVLAIIITIMVLELKVPTEPTLRSLRQTTGSSLLAYLLSFVYVGIYWNNHHHLFQIVERIRGGVLWANLHLLFWLSLYPFTTSWMDGTGFQRVPVIVYGADLMGAAIAYYILQSVVVRAEGEQSALRSALGADVKGKLSPLHLRGRHRGRQLHLLDGRCGDLARAGLLRRRGHHVARARPQARASPSRPLSRAPRRRPAGNRDVRPWAAPPTPCHGDGDEA